MDNHLVRSTSPVYLISYGVLIILFAYFYTAIQFDPHKQADQIRKQGGFIPGIRPGYQTERYLAKILNRITLPGALFVAGVALSRLSCSARRSVILAAASSSASSASRSSSPSAWRSRR